MSDPSDPARPPSRTGDPAADAPDDGVDVLVRTALLDAAAATVASVELVPDPVTAVRRKVAERRRRRRAVAVVAAAAAVAVVVAAVALVAGGDDAESVDVVSPSTVTTDVVPPTASTESEPTPSTDPTPSVPSGGTPLAFRSDVALAWTGREVVVWGGDVEAFNMGVSGPDRTYTDGAAYDPETGTWRTMSPSPFTGADVDVSRTAVVVDDGVVVVAGNEAALWDPDTDTWRALDDAPGEPWEAADVVGGGGAVVSVRAGAVLDVTTGRWDDLPEPPVTFETESGAVPTTAWTGDEVVVAGRAPGFPPGPLVAAAYDPVEATWREVADPPEVLGGQAPTSTWDGERLVVVTYDMGAATYDPDTDGWTELPSVPARFSEWLPYTVASGGTTVTTMAQATAVLGPDDRWTPLPHGPLPVGSSVAVDPPSAGTARVATWVVDSEAEESTLVVSDLGDLVGSTTRRQVGGGSIDLGPDDELLDATFVEEAQGLIETVRVEVEVAEGGTCTVTSTYLGIVGPGLGATIPEELPVDGGVQEWFRDEAGTTWEAAASTSDRFRIECTDAGAARRLASSTRFG